jgi:hypothetical protein
MTHVMNITRQSITICVRLVSGNHDMRGTCEWTHSLLSSPLLSFFFMHFSTPTFVHKVRCGGVLQRHILLYTKKMHPPLTIHKV